MDVITIVRFRKQQSQRLPNASCLSLESQQSNNCALAQVSQIIQFLGFRRDLDFLTLQLNS